MNILESYRVWSKKKNLSKRSRPWIEAAEKVWHYRRDLLDDASRVKLRSSIAALRSFHSAPTEDHHLERITSDLHGLLKEHGGNVYNQGAIKENVEFFLWASIVVIGFQFYIARPFKIPTNSMWPSYYGMTGEVFKTPADEPGVVMQGFRFLTELAMPKRIDAPVDGEVIVPVNAIDEHRGMVPFRMVPGRRWLVLPTQLREYQLAVGQTTITIRVPGDFDFDRVLLNAYFNGADNYPVHKLRGTRGWLRTGKVVKQGERMLAFDILTGDQLFVDRLSYHFMRPAIGDGFVFRTRNIEELHPFMQGAKDQYYIKRLVGRPGDTLEIREPVLYRNGAPITGSSAFGKNGDRKDRYPGYRYAGRMTEGESFTVPPDSYLALGDNSASSLDGRYWGAVPAKDVVGRPLFIYYPFTRRWGPAP